MLCLGYPNIPPLLQRCAQTSLILKYFSLQQLLIDKLMGKSKGLHSFFPLQKMGNPLLINLVSLGARRLCLGHKMGNNGVFPFSLLTLVIWHIFLMFCPLFKCQMACLAEQSIRSWVLRQLIMLVIEMITNMSKMAIKFMKCVKCQIHFSTKRHWEW